ncbi:MAG: rRNA maturation RNase YbeY [Silicimonas sp.]|nr:rRNA maturation RNase YbeY [Silicimonas sp.]
MAVDTLIEDDRWSAARLPELAERAVQAVLAHLALDPEVWEVALLGCDDARIAVLNGDFRAKPQPTNVLSWPSEERGAAPGEIPAPPEGGPELGDIAIAYETTMKEAESGKKPPEHHILHLIVHGVLHLLGYDHENETDADLMESTEIVILEALGVPNPYAE